MEIFKSHKFLSISLFSYLILSWIESIYRTMNKMTITQPVELIHPLLIASSIAIALCSISMVIRERNESVRKNEFISLNQIIFAYFVSIGAFSMIYFRLFQLRPEYFNYEPNFEGVSDGVVQLLSYFDFIVFSSYKSISQTYFGISENHNVVSLIILMQMAFSIYIVSVLINSAIKTPNK